MNSSTMPGGKHFVSSFFCFYAPTRHSWRGSASDSAGVHPRGARAQAQETGSAWWSRVRPFSPGTARQGRPATCPGPACSALRSRPVLFTHSALPAPPDDGQPAGPASARAWGTTLTVAVPLLCRSRCHSHSDGPPSWAPKHPPLNQPWSSPYFPSVFGEGVVGE